jgi:hypothetical protein
MINNILSIKYLHNHTAHIWLFASRSYVLVEFVRRMFDAWNWLDACLGIVIVRFWPLFWGAKQLIETAPNENWFVWNQQKTDILFKHHFFSQCFRYIRGKAPNFDSYPNLTIGPSSKCRRGQKLCQLFFLWSFQALRLIQTGPPDSSVGVWLD